MDKIGMGSETWVDFVNPCWQSQPFVECQKPKSTQNVDAYGLGFTKIACKNQIVNKLISYLAGASIFIDIVT